MDFSPPPLERRVIFDFFNCNVFIILNWIFLWSPWINIIYNTGNLREEFSGGHNSWNRRLHFFSFCDTLHMTYHWKALWSIFRIILFPSPSPTLCLCNERGILQNLIKSRHFMWYIVDKFCDHLLILCMSLAPSLILPLLRETFNLFQQKVF